MGLLDRILGAKKQPKEVAVSLDEVPAFLENAKNGKKEKFDKLVGEKFSEIKYVLSQIQSSLKELEQQPLRGENAKLSKIVGTSREQAISRLSSLAEKMQPPSSSNPVEVRQYCIEGNELLHREIQHSGKSIAYTGIYLKESMKGLGENIKELAALFSSLNEAMPGFSPLFVEPQLKESLKALKEKSLAVEGIREDISENREKLEALAVEKEKVEKQLALLTKSSESKELLALQEKKASLVAEKQSKKTELFSMIGKIDKPLRRFSKAVDARKVIIPAKLQDTLHYLEQNPLEVLRKDQKGESIKALLLELKSAIDSNLVDLKEKEKGKKLQALDELIAFDFFSKIFWEFNEIDAKIVSVEKEISANPVSSKTADFEKKIKESEKAAEEAGFRLSGLMGQLEKERESVSSLRQKITDLLQSISLDHISLR